MSAVARTTFLPILRLFVVEFWANMHQTDDVTLLHWPLTSDVTAHVGGACHRTPSLYQVSSSWSPLRKIWRLYRLSINKPRDFDLWPFNFYFGSRVSHVMCFLPANFQPAVPFHSRLRVRHGTDRRTDRRRPSTLNALILRKRGHNHLTLVSLLLRLLLLFVLSLFPGCDSCRSWPRSD